MRILDRYISTSIIKIFLGTVFIFCLLYVLIDATAHLDEFMDRGISFSVLLKYYAASLPLIFVQTSSVACLLAVLFTYSHLNNNNEIIAMRSSGLHFWHIARPALFFALIISMLIFWLNEQYVPYANAIKENIRENKMVLKADRVRKQKEKIQNLTFYGLKNRLFYIETFDPEHNELEGIVIIGYDERQNIREKILAHKAQWTGVVWKFLNCRIETYLGQKINNPTDIKVYSEKLLDIEESPEELMKQRLDIASMNIRQLKDYIDRFSNSGAARAINNLLVDLYQKAAYPFGNFIIVLIGLPFALMLRGRKGTTFTSFGLAVAIGFLYYVADSVALAFGKGGYLPPLLSAWAAPLLFGSTALGLIKKNFS